MSTPKNEKSHLNSVLAGLLIIIIIDYFSLTYQIVPGTQGFLFMIKLNKLSFKVGEIIRLFFLFVYALIIWKAYRNKLVIKSSLTTPTARYTYILLSLVFTIGFAEISFLPVPVIKYLYPFVFLLLCIFVALLVATFNEPIEDESGGTILGVEKKQTDKPLGFSLPAHGGFINIPNPFRSIYVGGGAGAGKTASVAEPIIFQMMEKRYAGFVYDFKYPTLGNVVYSSLLYHQNKEVKFYPVSFTDLARSYRFNPIDPGLLSSSTYAEEYAFALYCNLDKEVIKKGNFFSDSAIGLLKSVIWFMKKNHPEYCTLPHVINIILNADTKTLVNMIISDIETKGMVKSVQEAAEKEAYDQLAGVVGSLTMNLQKVNTPEITWVFTGNDFTLDLNNPRDPKFVIFGSLPELKLALNPVIAFASTIALKLMNSQGKQQSAAIIDEGPTIFIPNLDTIPATARSNKLAVVYMAQDFSQIDSMYGKDNRKALIGNLAYQFYGNTSELETAKHVSEMVGEEYQTIASHNLGGSSSESGDSSSKGVNYSKQKRKIVEPQEMMTLKQGTFIGKLVESENDWFKAPMKRIIDSNEDFELFEIPKFVQDFILTSEEEFECIEKVREYSNNPMLLRRDVELNNLLNAYFGDTKNEKFIKELESIIYERRVMKKRSKILDSNFEKVQNEVKEILSQYSLIIA